MGQSKVRPRMSIERLRLINRCLGIIIVLLYLALAVWGLEVWLQGWT